jgi:hypothetical protein
MVFQTCRAAVQSRGVTGVLPWCYSGVTVVLQWCYSGVAPVEMLSAAGVVRGQIHSKYSLSTRCATRCWCCSSIALVWS